MSINTHRLPARGRAAVAQWLACSAYAQEPQFERFVQKRAERLRDRGRAVDIWR